MPLQPGTRLGPYEILSAIGAGGMGDVYRAKDTKLRRDVALKVLPDAVAADPHRLVRFQREAQVLASLNHPNIAHIYGVEDSNCAHGLIMELVEGPTLGERIAAGAIPPNETLTIARQVAEALDAAHEQGVIHRDLKPSNIKLRPDGVAKVLDFGLAKLAEEPTASAVPSTMTTLGQMTSAGTILGTAAYMSPEQSRGQPVDKRTDIWAFGCVLFEMLTGRAPFNGETISDIIAAILNREPDLTTLPASTPPGIRRLLKRCLEKDTKRRLHDIADARIEIDDALAMEPTAAGGDAAGRKRTLAPWLIGGLVAAGGLLAAYTVLAARRPVSGSPVYHQVTFRRGSVTRARFAPDGQTVVYSAAWERPPVQLLSTRIDNADTSALPLPSAGLLSISKSGKMAVALPGMTPSRGTLAEVSLGGQAPRELVSDVIDADWAPAEDALAITHFMNGKVQLEYPIGRVLHSAAVIRSPRFSPKGDLIAFIEFDLEGAGGGTAPEATRLCVVDATGRVTVITKGWGEMAALAWHPSGDEIWFSAREIESRSGGLALHAVTLSGAHRLVASMPGIVVLQQISPDGRVLLSHEQWPVTMMCQAPGTTSERDMSWLDFSKARDMSPDGRLVLFDENGLAEGTTGGVYLRKVDGSAAVRIGDGQALSLSRDGATAVTRSLSRQLRLVPTGPGQTRVLRRDGLNYLDASWFPDGSRLLIAAQEPKRPPFLFVQDLAGGAPRRLVEGATAGAVSPDGRIVASMGAAGSIVLTPVDGSQPRTLTGVPTGASIARWEASGRYLFLKASSEFGVNVFRVDIVTGHSEAWRTLAPSDVAGVRYPTYSLAMTPDGQSYCYSYGRRLSNLFVVSGLK
jgi:eukaryotic-like serine/threonine-protein kinase